MPEMRLPALANKREDAQLNWDFRQIMNNFLNENISQILFCLTCNSETILSNMKAHLLFYWVVWLPVSQKVFCIQDINLLTCVLNIFPIFALFFTVLMVFVVQKFLIFMLPHVPIIFFMVYGIFAMPRSFHSKIIQLFIHAFF